MVAPTYFFACGIFEDAGFAGRLRAVREDAQGIDLEGFERMLVEDEREGREKGEWSDAPVRCVPQARCTPPPARVLTAPLPLHRNTNRNAPIPRSTGTSSTASPPSRTPPAS